MQDDLQIKYTGGTVFHGFLGEAIDDWKACRNLVKTIASNYKLPYFTVTPTYSICPVHGYMNGEHFYCPKCEKEGKAKILTRINKLEKEEKAIS